jgi:hypothetical protein
MKFKRNIDKKDKKILSQPESTNQTFDPGNETGITL